MSAFWEGRVRLSEADARTGHYYVTCRDGRKTAFLLGPFTQTTMGKEAHARALGYVRAAKRIVQELDLRNGPWLEYGTARIDLCGSPPAGKLNDRLLR